MLKAAVILGRSTAPLYLEMRLQGNSPDRLRAPRIGVVLDAFDASYQSELVKFLSEACRARRLELIVFPCGIFGAPDLSAPERNSLYRLISTRGPVDALVLLGSTILRHKDEIQRWGERLRPLPMCSIGLELDGMPSVLPDNQTGIRELVRHLVVEHGARRLAFLGGPEGNQESRERLAAFRMELGEHGLDAAQAPCLHGDFLPQSGRDATRALLEQPGHRLDAIVSANDYMALGILEVLATRAALSERQIAVTGFDNVVEAAFTMPPLTTVEQPLQKLADAAIGCLLAQLDGSPEVALPRVPTRLWLRRSCGCQEPTPTLSLRLRARAPAATFETFSQRLPQVGAELQRASEGLFVGMPGWDRDLVTAFVEQLRGVPGERFPRAVDAMLQNLQERRAEVWRFHGVLSVLRASALEALGGDPKKSLEAEDLLHAARLLTGAAAMRAQAREHARIEEVQRILNRMGAHLSECSDLPSLRAALDVSLPTFGISRARLLVAAGAAPDGTPLARLCYSLGEPSDGVEGAGDGTVCAARDLLPPSAGPRTATSDAAPHWVVLPLFFRQATLGYALLELIGHNGADYEALRIHSSSALASALGPCPVPSDAMPPTQRSGPR
jgi:phosphoserine phosphatase RsbU/P